MARQQQQQSSSQGMGQHATAGTQVAPAMNGQTPLTAAAGSIPAAPQLMASFMANPALAAATAMSNPFSPALLNVSGPFLGMPGVFAAAQMQGTTAASAPGAATTATAGRTGTDLAAQTAQRLPIFIGNGINPTAFAHASNAPALGGMSLPAMAPQSSTAAQVQLAATAAAAAAAAPLKPGSGKKDRKPAKEDLTQAEKAKQHRERNREHARSTRLRKKAYVLKLKELVEKLHAERTEEGRKRRVSIQHLADVQNVRRSVVRSFLKYHANYENEPMKWMTILEENCWLKQPVTPFRSFRRTEIEQDCRVSHGIEAIIADSASLTTMVEGIGSRSTRWMQIKREQVLHQAETRSAAQDMPPHSIVRERGRLQHAVSSLSSSSGSSHGSSGEEDRKRKFSQIVQHHTTMATTGEGKNCKTGAAEGAKKVSASSSGSESRKQQPSNEFHVYNAPSLPDPLLDSEGSNPGDDSTEGMAEDPSGAEEVKQVSSDTSSSVEEDGLSDFAVKQSDTKRLKKSHTHSMEPPSTANGSFSKLQRPTRLGGLPPNIAKSGGISHNVRPVSGKLENPRLGVAPATPLPPFAGIGKRSALAPGATTTVGMVKTSTTDLASTKLETSSALGLTATVSLPRSLKAEVLSSNSDAEAGMSSSSGRPMAVAADAESSSNESSNENCRIRAYYHINEDDMLLTDDVLMCPFIFRSQDAVLRGALAECIMPGMLRAHFSPRNKLLSLEMLYDAMGFMQQLERASGSDGSAEIVPGSLEMALAPSRGEARVITMAAAPYLIVSVNEAWTKMTKYTQMEVEGRDITFLNGKRTNLGAEWRPGRRFHAFEEAAQGRAVCSTNIHYDKEGREFVHFMCSYPLTNANDEITHILHVSKEFTVPPSLPYDFQDSSASNGSDEPTQ